MKLLDQGEKPEDFMEQVRKKKQTKNVFSEVTSFTSQNFSIQFL